MKIRHAAALLLASPLLGAYSYYYSDTLTSINSNNWYQNGTLTATSTGLTSSGGSGGSLISKPGISTGNDYEIRTTLNIVASGGGFFHYLRASSDAKRDAGSTGSF
jgi:hypothetical protein